MSTAQAMIYARLLAGKEREAWKAVEKFWFGTKLSQRIEPKLHPDALHALNEIKKYFRSPNLVFKVRNSFAFHYSAAAIGETWERASQEPFFETILGGNISNNFFLAAETAANVAVFSAIEPTDLQEGMRRFLDEVGTTTTQFTCFLEGVNMALVQEAGGKSLWELGVVDEVFPALPQSQVTMPHFCLPEPQIEESPGTNCNTTEEPDSFVGT